MRALLAVFLLGVLGVRGAILPTQICPTNKCATFVDENGDTRQFARFYACTPENAQTAFTVTTLPQLQLLASSGHRVVITNGASYVMSAPDSYPIKNIVNGTAISFPDAGHSLKNVAKVAQTWNGPTALLRQLVTNDCGSAAPIGDHLFDSCGHPTLELEQADNHCAWDIDHHPSGFSSSIEVYVDFDNGQFACSDEVFECISAATGESTGEFVSKNYTKLCEFDPCSDVQSGDVCATDISSCGTTRDVYHNCQFRLCWDGTDCQFHEGGCEGGVF
jgi:hypothetical protein